MRVRWHRWCSSLDQPVDAASVGFFRFVFGACVAWDAWRFMANGWVHEYLVRPLTHFTYPFFGWVQPWSGVGMYVHFWILLAAALLVSLGLAYRVAVLVVFVAYAHFFLIEQSIFMNHYYLILLLAFLLNWIPADRALSLPHLIRRVVTPTVPYWCVLLLRFQLFVLYFYGALAKLNPDWLRGEPMYSAMVGGGDGVPEFVTELPHVVLSLLAIFIAYAGLLIDFSVPILLCFRRTRWLGFVLVIPFHLMNEAFLEIGIFSFLALGAIPIFLEPDWPRRALDRIGFRLRPPDTSTAAAATSRWVLVALHLYVLLQLAFPLRHLLYPGYVSWTEEGHRFAWQMKLRRKVSEVTITATDPRTGRSWVLRPSDDLIPRQVRKLETFPDILLQYVHWKRDQLLGAGLPKPIIRVRWTCSLNGRPAQLLVDPSVDLASTPRTLAPATWILPLADRPA